MEADFDKCLADHLEHELAEELKDEFEHGSDVGTD
jgi:hypothetical protein